MFDLAKVPFSRYGSYFSLSTNRWGGPGKGLYLHVHYANSPQVFKVDPVCDGRLVGYRTEVSPSLLKLKPETGGEIEFVIAGQETIRIRGRGATLRLEMPAERWTFAYQLPGGWAFNFAPSSVQLGLDAMHGSVEMKAPWEKGKGFCWETTNAVGTISPDTDGTFEIAIDTFLTAWIKPARPPFDACREEVAREYEAWTKNLPAAEPEYEKTRDLAAYVNWSAVLAPAGNLTRATMFMSKYSMCNVYHWDHAFNAMAHCRHQPDLAWDQLLVMYDRRDAHGKCPSSMNRHEIRYTISNPPVQGWALRRMWDDNPALFTPERMAEAYDYLSQWTNWICKQWTWPGDRLPFYHHGFDSGWDNSSIFDQGVPVISPDQPAYLVLQMETLADLAGALDRKEEAAEWKQRRDTMLKGLVEDLWRDDHFVGLIRPSGKVVECQSLINCMPLVLGRRLPESVARPLVARVREHLAPHGLATEKLDSPKYEEGGYWRGPIWAPPTMLVVCGLLDIGERELAGTIMRAFCNLCRDHGFYENFSPRTGEGHFCPSYTWTSSVFMIFQGLLTSGCGALNKNGPP